jgi:hypothetical protein
MHIRSIDLSHEALEALIDFFSRPDSAEEQLLLAKLAEAAEPRTQPFTGPRVALDESELEAAITALKDADSQGYLPYTLSDALRSFERAQGRFGFLII